MRGKQGRRQPKSTPSIAAGRAREVVEIVVREAGELNARRCLQTIVVVDDSWNARPGTGRRAGAVTSKTIDVDAIEAMLRGDVDLVRGRDVDDEPHVVDDESFDLVRSEPEVVS